MKYKDQKEKKKKVPLNYCPSFHQKPTHIKPPNKKFVAFLEAISKEDWVNSGLRAKRLNI